MSAKSTTGEQKQAEPQWYALRCQTKREHIAASILRGVEGIETFCPRIRFKKTTRRGTIWWVEPLFPGYLLAKFDYKAQSRIVQASQGVSGIVRFGNDAPPVPEAFVELIRQEVAAQSEEDILVLKPTLVKGDSVEMAAGPFAGVAGTVQEPLSGTERVRVLMDFLGQERVIEVDLYSLILPKRPSL